MSTPATVPILDPTGKVWDIPYEHMQDALAKGGKMGVYMKAPDGSDWVIPADRVQDASKSGGKVVPYNLDQSHQKEGFWKTAGSDLGGMLRPTAQNPYPGMGQEQKGEAAQQSSVEDEYRKRMGYGATYRALAPVAEAVGTNVPGMEQAAQKGDQGAVLAHAATPIAAYAALRGGTAAVKAGTEALPSTERAGGNFQEVMGAAKDAPVNISNAQEPILRLMDWQRKTQLGPTLNKFLNRVTDPKQGPLTYGEARDFYQLLGGMSANEKLNMAPAIKYELSRTVAGLKTDIGNAAGSVGKAQQYYDAMDEFRNAKKLEDISDASKEIIVESLKRAVPYGVGTGIGVYGVKKLADATR